MLLCLMEIHSETQEPKPRRLSLCGKIVVFQHVSARGRNRYSSEVSFSSLSFKPEGGAFKQERDGRAVVDRGRSSNVDIVKCQCVFSGHERVDTPCVLLALGGDAGRFQYRLLTLSHWDSLEACMDFELPCQIREHVSILRGPSVLCSHAGSVYHVSLRDGEVTVREIAVTPHAVIGLLPSGRGDVVLLKPHNPTACTKRRPTTTHSSQILAYFLENGRTLDGALFLPHAYSSVIRCVFVLSVEKVNDVFESALVAATCKKQLVYFENGIPKEVCQLPFDGPEDIQMVNTGRNGCLFIIYFDQGHVCAIWKETLQVASCWSGVSSVHVDDFLCCGTEQLLLVFEDEEGTGHPLDNFVLTDLCGTMYSGRQGKAEVKTSHPAQENYLLTLQALESRLQSGLTVLQDLQKDVRVKEKVLLQSVQALRDIVSGRDPVLTPYEQDGLFALWEEDDEPKHEGLNDETQDVTAEPSKPQVDRLWYRIVEDHLVVGVILSTDGSIPVDCVSLSVLTGTWPGSAPAVIQTRSQALRLPTSTSSPPARPEPAAKRSKRDDASEPGEASARRLAVTAVTRLTSLLNPGCIECPVMLHYVQRPKPSASLSNPTPVVFQCGLVPLDIHSDFQTQLLKNPKLATDEAREDLLSLLAVLGRWVVHVVCPDHSLGDVDGWIQRTVGCERLEVSPQYLLFDSAGPSAVMLLCWRQASPFQGELSIHSSQLQALQFLDSFCSFLPASCCIRPCRETGRRETLQVLSLSLEKEALSLKESASSLLAGEESEGETPEPGEFVEEHQGRREAWQRDVQRSRKWMSPLVDVARYRRTNQSLSKVQLEGDIATLLRTQRGSFSSGPHQ